jgi:hypothetical protein
MDLDDKLIHYLIIGLGLASGSLLKTAFDWLSKTFWKNVIHIGREEYEQFKAWKASQGKK